jgi:serine/threonine protein kinase
MIANQFEVVGHLGSGATADVKLVRHITSGQEMACKIMKTDSSGQIPEAVLKDVEREVSLVSKMEHGNIVNVHAVGRGPYQKSEHSVPREVLFVLMENAEEGEMFDMISNTGKFSEPVARYYFLQLLTTLNYMHNTVGVCHRDLKPENILLDRHFNIKIADFGFATSLNAKQSAGRLTSYKGTLGYMPPEQLAKKSYSGKAADLFSAAVVLFMMVSQCQPFEEARVTDKFYKFIAGNKSENYWSIFERVGHFSQDLKDLLTGMFQLDPAARFTLEEIFVHPWMQGPVPTFMDIQKEFVIRKKTNDFTKGRLLDSRRDD